MKIVSTTRSPNYTELEIPVEFVVLHYTAGSLQRTLEIFMDRAREVSSHLVIDTDGVVYEVVPCLDGRPRRAWHAGKSRLAIGSGAGARTIEAFNDRSVGIELVNINGNVFPYTEEQYVSLFSVIERLKGLYPALGSPESVVGHEQIAGFRGKCDPGRCFDWARLFAVCYPNQGAPQREAICGWELAESVRGMLGAAGVVWEAESGRVRVPAGLDESLFNRLSALCEASLSADRG